MYPAVSSTSQTTNFSSSGVLNNADPQFLGNANAATTNNQNNGETMMMLDLYASGSTSFSGQDSSLATNNTNSSNATSSGSGSEPTWIPMRHLYKAHKL